MEPLEGWRVDVNDHFDRICFLPSYNNKKEQKSFFSFPNKSHFITFLFNRSLLFSFDFLRPRFPKKICAFNFFPENNNKLPLMQWTDSNTSYYSWKTMEVSITWWRPPVAIRKGPRALATSVTRLGDLLDFGQLFKAFGNNLLAQISHYV